MAWYDKSGNEKDIILSSRVRLARNLAAYPFAAKMDDTSAREIIEKIEQALKDAYTKTDMSSLSALETVSLVEKHTISREFAQKEDPHALFANAFGEVFVMACEEDHIRLQAILSGYELDRAYALARECDKLLEGKLKIAYDSELGYLTHCPTNLGTGMRASVMMFLPALTHSKKISSLASQLSKLGLTIRGMYGEGSGGDGMIYQISNQVTLGISEEDTLSKLKEVIAQICELEYKYRTALKDNTQNALDDRIGRAEGILRYARSISTAEFMKLYSDVRLGVSFGLVENITLEQLDTLLVSIHPATLMLECNKKEASESERDRVRASYIKSKLN